MTPYAVGGKGISRAKSHIAWLAADRTQYCHVIHYQVLGLVNRSHSLNMKNNFFIPFSELIFDQTVIDKHLTEHELAQYVDALILDQQDHLLKEIGELSTGRT